MVSMPTEIRKSLGTDIDRIANLSLEPGFALALQVANEANNGTKAPRDLGRLDAGDIDAMAASHRPALWNACKSHLRLNEVIEEKNVLTADLQRVDEKIEDRKTLFMAGVGTLGALGGLAFCIAMLPSTILAAGLIFATGVLGAIGGDNLADRQSRSDAAEKEDYEQKLAAIEAETHQLSNPRRGQKLALPAPRPPVNG